MTKTICLIILLPMIISFCNNKQTSTNDQAFISRINMKYKTISEIPTPQGFQRIMIEKSSFSQWLRQIKLREDPKVYLYNGRLKANQSAQFAVLDISIGSKDLQQCADAVMRLKAEYFFSRNRTDSIHFKATDGTILHFGRWLKGERHKLNGSRLSSYLTHPSHENQRMQLEKFLEVIFTYCGTLSLDKETYHIDLNSIQPGDVFVKGGFPGHAMIVADVAINQKNEKIFMLAQSYMPAQDIHIVKNPGENDFSPWYKVTPDLKIITPEWVFNRNQLKRW
jgi:hypothetical protein